jgi:hypothetical protein
LQFHSEAKAARQVMTRIKMQLDKHARENGNKQIKISIGMGVATEAEPSSTWGPLTGGRCSTGYRIRSLPSI